MVIEDSAHPAAPAVEVYDFGRPATLSRENTRVLEGAFDTFARQWAGQLSARTRARVQITVDSVALQAYDEYADGLPATTMVVLCTLPDSDSGVLVQFPVSAAISWIVQMVGGRAREVTEDRVLTPLEQALIRALAEEALESLTHALGGLLPHGAAVSGIHYSAPFVPAVAAGELVVVARLSLRVGERTVPASVLLPAAVVLAAFTAHGTAPTPLDPTLLRRQIEASSVQLSLRLAPRTIRPREVLSLSVGDLIAIPHAADRPLELVIGGHAVAAAAVGTSGARLACVVTATAPQPAPAEESA